MKKLTYAEAYDKIIQAYFRDEIEPYLMEFCFCGNLSFNKERDDYDSYWDYNQYSSKEYHSMELALLKIIKSGTVANKYGSDIYMQNDTWRNEIKKHPNYEDALFEGMSAALEVLKQIHRERGEDVDTIQPAFTKRKLKSVC